MTEKKKVTGGQIKYRPEMNEAVIEMGRAGLSVTQMAAKLGVSRRSLVNWRKDDFMYPGFGEAMEKALTEAENHWESIGQAGIMGAIPKWHAIAWIYMMKARFKDRWQDHVKQDINLTRTDAQDMTAKELDAKVKDILDRTGK